MTDRPADTLRRAVAMLRAGRPASAPNLLTNEYPDLDSAVAALLEMHAIRAEFSEDFGSEGDMKALAVARWVIGEEGGDPQTRPLDGIEVRDRCQHCPGVAMIPRDQMTRHLAEEHGIGGGRRA